MSTVKDIVSAIVKPSQGDLVELREWFVKFDADAWDHQIASNAQSGRLDAFYESLQRDNEGQADMPLGELLGQRLSATYR